MKGGKYMNNKFISFLFIALLVTSMISIVLVAAEDSEDAPPANAEDQAQAITNVETYCASALGRRPSSAVQNTYNVTVGQGFLLDETSSVKGFVDLTLASRNCQPRSNITKAAAGDIILRYSGDGNSALGGTRLSFVLNSSNSTTEVYSLKIGNNSRGALMLSAINMTVGAPLVQLRTGIVTFTNKTGGEKSFNVNLATYSYVSKQKASGLGLRARLLGYFAKE